MLSHVIERVQATVGLDEVVLATSESDRDTPLLAVAAWHGIRAWRGSEWDVLGRMCGAARWAEADVVLRVTADCPLWAPDVGELVLDAHRVLRAAGYGLAYAWNDTCRSGYPDGLDAEAFDVALLEQAAARATRQEDREHVTPGVRFLAKTMTTVRARFDLSRGLKLSVDREEDLRLVQSVARYLVPGRLAWPDTATALVACGLVSATQLEAV